MMALIFGALLAAALLLAGLRQARLAAVAILACLLLSIGEFLWLIYSPNTVSGCRGFRSN